MSAWGSRGVPRAVRLRVLERDHHVCQVRDHGCSVVAVVVDHVINCATLGIPRAEANDNDANLQGICRSWGARKTERERRAAHAASNARRAARRHLPLNKHPGD